MMEYPLCRQTVTVYRRQEDTVLRQVVEGCYLETDRQCIPADARQRRQFLLVVPGQLQLVLPGDRVLPGVGPEKVDWEQLLPIYYEELLVVTRVKRFYWDGRLCHVEAT